MGYNNETKIYGNINKYFDRVLLPYQACIYISVQAS